MAKPKDKIIDRIRKCLALAGCAGATEHEAAAAMRQAQKLMTEHAIGEQDLLAAEATEQKAKASALRQPARWESNLAGHCARVFACDPVFEAGFSKSHWVFLGIEPGPSAAQYGFEVLLRQAKKARKAYADKALTRCKPANRIRRADAFCDGWVYTAVGKLAGLTRTPSQQAAVDAYKAKHMPDIITKATGDRNKGKPLAEKDIWAGMIEGKKAQLHNGMGTDARKQLGVEG